LGIGSGIGADLVVSDSHRVVGCRP